MRYSSLTVLGTACLVLMAGCGDDPAPAAGSNGSTVVEIAHEIPRHASVLFENDYVLVAEFDLPPGGAIPPHYSRNRAVYALADYRLVFARGGEELVQEMKTGEISWHPAGEHSARNVGETTARFLVVFRKLSRLFEYSLTGDVEDVTCLAPASSEVLLENDTMRVARFILAPGASLPRHRGLNRVMYPLNSFNLRYVTGSVDLQYVCREGEALYFHAEPHEVVNVGETAAHYLMFELRE